jgi:xanthine dehydrogenase accessory factor
MTVNSKHLDGCEDSVVELGDGREVPDLAPLGEVLSCRSGGDPVALVTIIGTSGSAPRGMGSTMAVRKDGSIVGTVGGGNLELFAIRHALEALKDGRSRRLHYDFSSGPAQNVEKGCGGTTDFFIQPFVGSPRLVIFGAGHVGIALAGLAHACHFSVTVADDRKEFLEAAAFPAGTKLIAGPFAETAGRIRIDASTFVVIATYGHVQDEAVLEACLSLPWHYLGLVGSRAKIAASMKRLATTPEAQERLARIHAPVGLDLGGRSPAEIAVAIMAEILALRYGRATSMSLSAAGERGKAVAT